MAVGILQLIRAIRYKTDKDYQEKVDIAVSDERNQYIRMKAWSWTGYILVIGCAIATIACMVLHKVEYMQLFACIMSGTVFAFWVCYQVLLRKY